MMSWQPSSFMSLKKIYSVHNEEARLEATDSRNVVTYYTWLVHFFCRENWQSVLAVRLGVMCEGGSCSTEAVDRSIDPRGERKRKRASFEYMWYDGYTVVRRSLAGCGIVRVMMKEEKKLNTDFPMSPCRASGRRCPYGRVGTCRRCMQPADTTQVKTCALFFLTRPALLRTPFNKCRF